MPLQIASAEKIDALFYRAYVEVQHAANLKVFVCPYAMLGWNVLSSSGTSVWHDRKAAGLPFIDAMSNYRVWPSIAAAYRKSRLPAKVLLTPEIVQGGISKIRIFISSPGDAGHKRRAAAKVISRFSTELADAVELEPYFREHEPTHAGNDFQKQIPSLSEYDICVCILLTGPAFLSQIES